MSSEMASPNITDSQGPVVVSRVMITTTVMLGALMAIIDTNIVNVALSDIGASLGASLDELSWVVTGFIIAQAIVMPLTGWLTAYLGRKQFYALALALFTVSSLACGLSWNIGSLIIFRIIQGFGGGVLIPIAQAILLESYPPQEHGKAMAIFGMGVILGPAIGPALGGWLTDNISWRWIFDINVFIGVAAIAMTLIFIKNPTYIQKPQGKFDAWGLTLLTVCVSSMQFVLERGQHDDWFSSSLITILSITAILSLAGFIYRELTIKNPIVDLSVLKNKTFLMGNIIGLIMGFGMYGILLMLPLFLSSILHYDAWQVGLTILPGAIATAMAMPIAGFLADKSDPRISISVGLALVALGMFQFSTMTAQVGFFDLLSPLFLRGFGLGLVIVPLSSATLSPIAREHMSGASGLYTLLRQLGGSFGIAVLTTLLQRREVLHISHLAENISPYNPRAMASLKQIQAFMMSQGASVHVAKMQALAMMNNLVHAQGLTMAYEDLFIISGVAFLLCYIPLIFLIKHHHAIQEEILILE